MIVQPMPKSLPRLWAILLAALCISCLPIGTFAFPQQSPAPTVAHHKRDDCSSATIPTPLPTTTVPAIASASTTYLTSYYWTTIVATTTVNGVTTVTLVPSAVPTVVPVIFSGDISFGMGPVNAATVILGVLLIVIGGVLLFMGHRLFRFTLFLAGFVSWGVLAYVVISHIEPPEGWPNREWIYLGGCVLAGAVGGGLYAWQWKLGLVGIGALTGLSFALFLLSWRTGGLVDSLAARYIIMVIFVIIGVVVSFYFEKHVIILGTSLVGAFAIVEGFDFFLNTGFYQASRVFFATNAMKSVGTFVVNNNVYGMLVAVIILWIIGILVQYRINRGISFVSKKK
ncbi:uncharacterized protein BJ171DRAFT_578023 [Polychytrium aggregatum]|uniref:uncharacterized protein n=1 Tax=Polychytrium aggregatum TaxID=110093 RepID=UPI0022FF2879|nr:uncharacterized protein BJ171DRAFT_578023 [Polychytrium aggregatum]KAI9208209.1 hypothetical protein BJ171DRAFT_578023 [Polychytrium aggregatum]